MGNCQICKKYINHGIAHCKVCAKLLDEVQETKHKALTLLAPLVSGDTEDFDVTVVITLIVANG